jgi:dsDNA-specific endonuclease/ATPase MutS2
LPLSALSRDNLDKPGKRAVVSLLHFRWENTGGKFVELKVVGNAVAAFTFSGARLIGAGASGFVGFNLAFHSFKLHSHLK